jgi:hypothetical protein
MVVEVSDRSSTVASMPRGTQSPKISITMHPDVHERMVSAAHEEGLSVSAWISKAAEDRLAIKEGLQVVADWESEHGSFTPEELAKADARVREDLGMAETWNWQ